MTPFLTIRPTIYTLRDWLQSVTVIAQLRRSIAYALGTDEVPRLHHLYTDICDDLDHYESSNDIPPAYSRTIAVLFADTFDAVICYKISYFVALLYAVSGPGKSDEAQFTSLLSSEKWRSLEKFATDLEIPDQVDQCLVDKWPTFEEFWLGWRRAESLNSLVTPETKESERRLMDAITVLSRESSEKDQDDSIFQNDCKAVVLAVRKFSDPDALSPISMIAGYTLRVGFIENLVQLLYKIDANTTSLESSGKREIRERAKVCLDSRHNGI